MGPLCASECVCVNVRNQLWLVFLCALIGVGLQKYKCTLLYKSCLLDGLNLLTVPS